MGKNCLVPLVMRRIKYPSQLVAPDGTVVPCPRVQGTEWLPEATLEQVVEHAQRFPGQPNAALPSETNYCMICEMYVAKKVATLVMRTPGMFQGFTVNTYKVAVGRVGEFTSEAVMQVPSGTTCGINGCVINFEHGMLVPVLRSSRFRPNTWVPGFALRAHLFFQQ
jgi:hypothetical protein